MNFSKKLLFWFFFSQICFLWVFWLEENQYLSVSQEQSCWVFQKGSAISPNWLPEWWKAVIKTPELQKIFLQSGNCKEGNLTACCRDMWYIYTKSSIGIKTLSPERAAAEFLAGKKVITSQSLSPSDYKLAENLSRKEVMKIIINLSGKTINQNCREVFLDVPNDWACKYIETALDSGFIVGKQAFRPDENITKVEALKLIFQAKEIAKRYQTTSWQEDYISSAYYLGYIDEKFKDYNASATRGWMFEIVAKTYKDFSS